MELIRIDRNVLANIKAINAQTSERDRSLFKNLIVFVAYCFQTPILQENLFGYKILHPREFGAVLRMANNGRSLVNKHPTPLQFENLAPERVKEILDRDKAGIEPAWTSIFDNILYRAFYHRIQLTYGGRTPDGMSMSKLSELRIFSELTKYYSHKTRKVHYEYKESPTFINNLARYFMAFDFETYRQLTDKEGDVYMELLAIRQREIFEQMNGPAGWNYQPVVINKFSHDYLIELLDLKRKGGFSKEKDALNSMVYEINKKAKYEFVKLSWEKSSSRATWNNVPILEFPFSPAEVEYMKKESQQKLDRYLLFNLKEAFREKNVKSGRKWVSISEFNSEFKRYLYTQSADTELKAETLRATHVQCFGRELDLAKEIQLLNDVARLAQFL